MNSNIQETIDSDTSSDVSLSLLSSKRKATSTNVVTPHATISTPTIASLDKKELPVEFIDFDFSDFSKFLVDTSIDVNPKSKTKGETITQVLSVVIDDSGKSFQLTNLTVFQTRYFCKRVGLQYCGSKNKQVCRQLLAHHIQFNNNLDPQLEPSWYATKIMNNICRLVNVVFGESFIEDFKTVNDIKNRRDHETKTTYKSFWIKVTRAYNSCLENDGSENQRQQKTQRTNNNEEISVSAKLPTNDDESVGEIEDDYLLILNPSNNLHITRELELNMAIDLTKVDRIDVDNLRKKIIELFKIRRKVKDFMTQSGTHDNDPWNFVEAALSKNCGLSKITFFYFYIRCEEHPGIDANFILFLDENLKGDSTSIVSPKGGKNFKKGKEGTPGHVNDIITLGNDIHDIIKSSAIDRKQAALDRKETEERMAKARKVRLKIECAAAMKDNDLLQKIMEEIEENEY
jgi:hypothetical protein